MRADEDGVSPAADARAALAEHLQGGGGVLAMHTAIICFDDWPEWTATLGGAWRWGRSSHPPLGELAVKVAAPGHPLVAGLADFTIVDERYSDLDHGSDPPTPLLVADGLPLLWARVHGTAGWCTTLSVTTPRPTPFPNIARSCAGRSGGRRGQKSRRARDAVGRGHVSAGHGRRVGHRRGGRRPAGGRRCARDGVAGGGPTAYGRSPTRPDRRRSPWRATSPTRGTGSGWSTPPSSTATGSNCWCTGPPTCTAAHSKNSTRSNSSRCSRRT